MGTPNHRAGVASDELRRALGGIINLDSHVLSVEDGEVILRLSPRQANALSLVIRRWQST